MVCVIGINLVIFIVSWFIILNVYRLYVKLFLVILVKMVIKVVVNLEIDILKEEREGRFREVGN